MADILFDYLYRLGERQTIENQRDQNEFDEMMYGLADWLCLPAFAWVDLHHTLSTARPGDKLTIPEIIVEHKSGPAASSLKNRFQSDWSTFFTYPQLFTFIHGHGEYDGPPRDRWTQEMISIMHRGRVSKGSRKGKKSDTGIPAWLVWSTAIVQDIRWYLGDHRLNKGFEELQTNALLVRRSITHYLDWKATAKLEADQDKAIHALSEFIRIYFENDVTVAIDELEFSDKQRSRMAQNVKHLLFYKNPLWSGILLFWLRITLWRMSIDVLNSWRHVWATIHLYNTAEQEARKTGNPFTWMDLEHIIQTHGQEHLFVGDRPKTSLQYQSRFEITLGMSITGQFGRTSGSRPSRQLRPDALICNILAPRYRIDGLFPFHKKDILQDAHGHQRAEDLLHTIYSRKQSDAIVSVHGDSIHVNTVLDTLRALLDEEWTALNFDYLRLHVACAALLHQLHSTMPDYMPHEINRSSNAAEEMFTATANVMDSFAQAHKQPNTARAKRQVAHAHQALARIRDFALGRGDERVRAVQEGWKLSGEPIPVMDGKFPWANEQDLAAAEGGAAMDAAKGEQPSATTSDVEDGKKRKKKKKTKRKAQKLIDASPGDGALSLTSLARTLPSISAYAAGNDDAVDKIDAISQAQIDALFNSEIGKSMK